MKTAESIISTLNQPVLVIDKALRPIMANPAFFETLGLPAAELKAPEILGFISGDVCEPNLEVILEPIIKEKSATTGVETVYTPQPDQQLFLMVHARWVRMSGVPEMILVEPRDITRERRAEIRIQELNAALQEHVATVDAVNKELESYSHSVSHDLRTPLRFVNRIAHLILQEPGTQLSNGAAKQVNMILQATSEMAKLIGNLLVFSQVSRQPVKKRHVDLRRLFQDAEKELRHAHNGRDVEILVQELPPCFGDRTLIKEVVANLLENAFKFTRRCEKARIEIGFTEDTGETVYYVRDNGVGFDMSASELLFVPFHRLHKPTDFEGTGIGLALVKRIVLRHGGRIWAESEVNKGAVFYFTMGKETPG